MAVLSTSGFASLSADQAIANLLDVVQEELGSQYHPVVTRTYVSANDSFTYDFTITSIWLEAPGYEEYLNLCVDNNETANTYAYTIGFFDAVGPVLTGTRQEVRMAWNAWAAEHRVGSPAHVWVSNWHDQTTFTITYSNGVVNAWMDGYTNDYPGYPLTISDAPLTPRSENFAIVRFVVAEEITNVASMAWCSLADTGELLGTPSVVEATYTAQFNDEVARRVRYTYVVDGETIRLEAAFSPVLGQVVTVRLPADANPDAQLGPMTLHVTTDTEGILTVGSGVPISMSANSTKSISVGESIAEGGSVLLRFACAYGTEELVVGFIPGGKAHWVIIGGRILPGTQDPGKMRVHIRANAKGAVYDVTNHPLPSGVSNVGDLVEGEPAHDAWLAGLSEYKGLLPFSEEVTTTRRYAVMPSDANLEGLIVEMKFTANSTQYCEVEFGTGESPASELIGRVIGGLINGAGSILSLVQQYWWVILLVLGGGVLVVSSLMRR